MSLLACCVHDTETNDRFKYTKECMASFIDTVDLKKHRLFIINNGSYSECSQFLKDFIAKHSTVNLINLSKNVGTARGINLAMALREPGEYFTKFDNDVTWGSAGWVDALEKEMTKRPEIGILGLKRDDVYGELIPDRGLLMNKDVMGTCTMFNPAMLDKVGFMRQLSPFYGYDDVLMSVCSIAAGFKNAFLPSINITHLDDGKNPYCEWKRQEAGRYADELSIMCNLIKSGELPFYYDGE